MAHLITDGFVINDASWKLGIFVTDMNVSKELFVRGDTSIGSLMMSLVNEIQSTRDWSDHSLWWPE
jgi:kindlin 3